LRVDFGVVMAQRRLSELKDTFDIVMSLVKTKKINEAAPEILKILGTALDCSWGTYWMVDASLHVLLPLTTWSSPDVQAAELEQDTKSRTLTLSEGTAGHVWRSQKPIWTLDLAKDMCLPRSLDAGSAGLTSGVWFAIKNQKTVYAVVELLGKNLVSPTEELLAGIENLGIKLGHSLEEFNSQ
jgi:hypothetical protein